MTRKLLLRQRMLVLWCVFLLPVVKADAPPLGASIINPSWIWGQRVTSKHASVLNTKNFFNRKNTDLNLWQGREDPDEKNEKPSKVEKNPSPSKPTKTGWLSYTSYEPLKPKRDSKDKFPTRFWSDRSTTEKPPFLPFSSLGSKAGPRKDVGLKQKTNNPPNKGDEKRVAKKFNSQSFINLLGVHDNFRPNRFDDGTTKYRTVKDTLDLSYDKTFNDEGFNSIKSGFEGGFTSLATHLQDNLRRPPQDPSQKALGELGNLSSDEVYYADADLLIIKGGGFSPVHEDPPQDIQLTMQETSENVEPIKPSHEPAYGVNGIPAPFDISQPPHNEEYNGNIATIIGPPSTPFHGGDLFTLPTPGYAAASDYSPYALFLPADVFGSESQRYFHYKRPLSIRQPEDHHVRTKSAAKTRPKMPLHSSWINPVPKSLSSGHLRPARNPYSHLEMLTRSKYPASHQIYFADNPPQNFQFAAYYPQKTDTRRVAMPFSQPYLPQYLSFMNYFPVTYVDTNEIGSQFYREPWVSLASDIDVNYFELKPAPLEEDVELVFLDKPAGFYQSSVGVSPAPKPSFSKELSALYPFKVEQSSEEYSSDSVEFPRTPEFIQKLKQRLPQREKTTTPPEKKPEAVNKLPLSIPSHWVSLADDTKVNYRDPKPQVENDAELINFDPSSVKPAL